MSVTKIKGLNANLFFLINVGITFILGNISIFPPMRSIPMFNQFWAILVLGWFISITLAFPGFWFNNKVYRISVYVYILYALAVAFLTGNAVIANRYFELFQIPLFFIAYHTYRILGKENVSYKIILLQIPFIVFSCFATIKACIANPFAARELKRGAANISALRAGVGGYDLIYFLVVAFGILLFIYGNMKIKAQYKALVLFLLILFTATIISSNFMTALLLIIVAVGVRFLLGKITVNKVFILSIIFIITYYYSDIIIIVATDEVLNLMGESMNASRLLELKLLFLEDEQGLSLQARSNAYYRSFVLIFEHPFLGILTKPLVRIADDVSGFGQHSQILDTFALFGVPLGLLQLFVYFKPLLARFMQPNGKVSSFAFLVLLLTGLIFTLNVATPSLGFAIFFIFPVVYDKLNYNQIQSVNQHVLYKNN